MEEKALGVTKEMAIKAKEWKENVNMEGMDVNSMYPTVMKMKEMNEEEQKELIKKLEEIKPVIYTDSLVEEINHGNGLVTILEPKVIDYNHSALIWIRPFYNDIRQSFYFDEMLIIDDRMPKKMVKKIVERYGNRAIEKMVNENSYMVECFASYKAYYTRYFITNDELNLRLLELTF